MRPQKSHCEPFEIGREVRRTLALSGVAACLLVGMTGWVAAQALPAKLIGGAAGNSAASTGSGTRNIPAAAANGSRAQNVPASGVVNNTSTAPLSASSVRVIQQAARLDACLDGTCMTINGQSQPTLKPGSDVVIKSSKFKAGQNITVNVVFTRDNVTVPLNHVTVFDGGVSTLIPENLQGVTAQSPDIVVKIQSAEQNETLRFRTAQFQPNLANAEAKWYGPEYMQATCQANCFGGAAGKEIGIDWLGQDYWAFHDHFHQTYDNNHYDLPGLSGGRSIMLLQVKPRYRLKPEFKIAGIEASPTYSAGEMNCAYAWGTSNPASPGVSEEHKRYTYGPFKVSGNTPDLGYLAVMPVVTQCRHRYASGFLDLKYDNHVYAGGSYRYIISGPVGVNPWQK